MSLSKLRSEDNVDFVGYVCDDMPPSKLPTLRQVLAFFFCKVRRNHSVRSAAQDAIRVTEELWDKTKIPRVQTCLAIKRLEKVYQEWRSLKRHTHDRPVSTKSASKEAVFVDKLDKLFDLSLKGCEELLDSMIAKCATQKEKEMYRDEKLFLADQRGPRLAFIGGLDITQLQKDRERAAKEERKICRLLEQEKRRQRDAVKREQFGN
jgi:hypothetical protein